MREISEQFIKVYISNNKNYFSKLTIFSLVEIIW